MSDDKFVYVLQSLTDMEDVEVFDTLEAAMEYASVYVGTEFKKNPWVENEWYTDTATITRKTVLR